MKITIAERFHPFSHLNGTKFLLPKSTLMIQAFPTRLYFTDLEKQITPFHLSCDFEGPVKDFTAELDLEHGQLRVFGKTQKGYMRFFIHVKEDGVWLKMEKLPQERVCCQLLGSLEPHILSKGDLLFLCPLSQKNEQKKSQERLSLGMHKAQDWEFVCRRLDFKEIFPLWHALCAWLPEANGFHSKVGNFSLLEICKDRIKQKKRESVLEAFETFFLSAFEGVLTPRLFDTEHQGISCAAPFVEGDFISSLPLLTEGGSLIRSLFFQETVSELSILPCLPTAFECGRMVGIQTSNHSILDIEWTKKFLRRMCITSTIDTEIYLKFPKGISSFRLKKGRTTMRKISVDAEERAPLTLSANQPLHLDLFEA